MLDASTTHLALIALVLGMIGAIGNLAARRRAPSESGVGAVAAK